MERTGNITFSVIVPVYNVQAYLSACVKSVVEQAGPADWECILVDDGSTDACPAMCDAFAQLCPGVTVIHRSNGGLAAARNTGIKAAKGKWLLFLDSDDYWPPHMLEKLRAALAAAPGYRWYVCRYLEQDESRGMDAKPNCSYCLESVYMVEGDSFFFFAYADRRFCWCCYYGSWF